jgi:hypothetical protein
MLIWFHRSRSPKGAPKQYCRDLLQQPCTFNVLSSLGRRPARPRAAGRRGVGPVEDARRGAQGDRCLAGGDYMSQALNRQRAMGSLPEYSPPMLRPATGGPRIDGVICWNRICAVAEDRSRRNHHPGKPAAASRARSGSGISAVSAAGGCGGADDSAGQEQELIVRRAF